MVSLVVPGSSARMLEKARSLAVTEIVLDLEDAVVPRRKTEALEMSLAALERGFQARRVAVRVNPAGSPWHVCELSALAQARVRPESIVLPKACDPQELLGVVGRLVGMPIQVLVESALGVQRVAELCAVPQVEAVILGYADLAVSLGRSPEGAADLDLWLGVQDRVLVAARAAGVRAVDGPFLLIDDEAGLRASATRAARLGFDGKWVIHPAQIAAVVDAFTPSPASVAEARKVVKTLSQAKQAGAGAALLGGAMIDEPVRLAALRTLALAGDPDEP